MLNTALEALAVLGLPREALSNAAEKHDGEALLRLAHAAARAAVSSSHPTIDENDEDVVQVDVIGLKQVSIDTVTVRLRLVWSEDLLRLTLGRAWLRCGASDDVPL